jgi:hypothetical protein
MSSKIISRPYDKAGEETYERVFRKKSAESLKGWPEWCHKLSVIKLTQNDFDHLPEYSMSLPDSYKRPLSEGGRPWKRNVNVFRKFGKEDMWLYCEYRSCDNPKMLEVYSAHIEIVK